MCGETWGGWQGGRGKVGGGGDVAVAWVGELVVLKGTFS